jgi:hypothetical protein
VIVGSVLGGIIGLALIIGAIVFLVSRRRKLIEAVTSERWDNPELDSNQVWIQDAPVFAPVELSGQLDRPELQCQRYLAHERGRA